MWTHSAPYGLRLRILTVFQCILTVHACYDMESDTPRGQADSPEDVIASKHVLLFDATSFTNSGIATVRLYIIAAATISQHFGAQFVVPQIGHDNHLATMPGHGALVEPRLHAFGYYFDEEYFIHATRSLVELDAISSTSDSVSCSNAVWHQISLSQDDVIKPTFLRDEFPDRLCLQVAMGFPSIGTYTTSSLRAVRAAIAQSLRPSQRLRSVGSAVQAALLHATSRISCSAKLCNSSSTTQCQESSDSHLVARVAGFNAVYARADSDWQDMCNSYFFKNCFHPLEAYVQASTVFLSRDVPLLVAGKLSRNASVVAEFSMHFQNVWSLSMLRNVLMRCCEDIMSATYCTAILGEPRTSGAHQLTAYPVCDVLQELGEHDFAIVEHELCVAADAFLGNILSSFSFNVRDARALICQQQLVKWRRSKPWTSAYGHGVYWTTGVCGGAHVVGPSSASCSRRSLHSPCKTELELYVNGCSNTAGLALLSCWSRVLMGEPVLETHPAIARRLEKKIMAGMLNRGRS
ncbi:uncharacterized protein LOC135817446 [Sycon ciliatum]|uniref:uncharacterized protein LOC135817446 n=1 Tax=Sycon ciliatum TaxID=27933 RepID=UPI0031F65D90